MDKYAFDSFDLVVVGSGLYGLTIAERVANKLGRKVLVLEKRDHIGGNAFSYFDNESKIEVHKYGSHLFHTSNEKVWHYINKFTSFTNYTHRVYAVNNGKLYTLPFNSQTFSEVYGRYFTPSEIDIIHKSFSKKVDSPKEIGGEDSFETRAKSMVGEKIYEILIEEYTKKQWQMPIEKLPASIISRLPIRNNLDGRYFGDKYQGLPSDGYMNIFKKMIESERIEVRLNSDFFKIRDQITGPIVFTGPIDKFYDFRHGSLNWRTIDLEFEKLYIADFQGNSVINYTGAEVPFTRIHEFKHLHPERTVGEITIIAREYSRFAGIDDEPYYPVNSKEDVDKLKLYRRLAGTENRILFGGRLGSYQYLDMHMAIASALSDFDNIVRDWFN